jgi:C4-dicarboxylate transporter DctQ subunit
MRTAPALLRSWDKAERLAIGLLAAFGLFAALYQALTRYALPQYAEQWATETVVYALIWAVFLASSTLAGTDGHVRADLFLRLMSRRARRGVEIFNTVIALIFTIALTYYGVLIAWEGYLFDERSMTTLRFPMWIYFACVPVGAALMVLRYARRLYLLVFTQDPTILEFDQHGPSTVD